MIITGDAIEEMRKLAPGSIRAVVTSPPYNLTTTKKTKGLWVAGTKFMNAGYDDYSDDMPLFEYIDWQRRCLFEMMRVIGDDGAIFYNHKERVQNGLIQDRTDILEGFPVRQTIVWDRGSGFNFNPGYFVPVHEYVYLIAKRDFKLAPGANRFGTVWRIPPETGTEHPCPFPLELAKRCLLAAGSGTILDPFFGSGTTGVAATALGFDWIGIERSAAYVQMARRRLDKGITSELPLEIANDNETLHQDAR